MPRTMTAKIVADCKPDCDCGFAALKRELDAERAESKRLKSRLEALEGALNKIERELTVGAAEYVPAIPAARELAIAALRSEFGK